VRGVLARRESKRFRTEGNFQSTQGEDRGRGKQNVAFPTRKSFLGRARCERRVGEVGLLGGDIPPFLERHNRGGVDKTRSYRGLSMELNLIRVESKGWKEEDARAQIGIIGPQ